MPRSNPAARARLVAAAATLLARRGMAAASIRESAREAQAALGSTYHFFPGGKQQLIAEAVLRAGDEVSSILQQSSNGTPVQMLEAFRQIWSNRLEKTDFRAGCPVLAVAVDDSAGDETGAARAAASEVFRNWESLLSDSLSRHGVQQEEAATLATLIVSSIEGAIALCRVQRSVVPLERVVRQLVRFVAPAPGRRRRGKA